MLDIININIDHLIHLHSSYRYTYNNNIFVTNKNIINHHFYYKDKYLYITCTIKTNKPYYLFEFFDIEKNDNINSESKFNLSTILHFKLHEEQLSKLDLNIFISYLKKFNVEEHDIYTLNSLHEEKGFEYVNEILYNKFVNIVYNKIFKIRRKNKINKILQ